MQEQMETTGEISPRQKRPLQMEDWLYLLALGLALLMRVVLLNSGLSELEAGYVWQAYQVSRGEAVSLLSNPGYILPTGLLFYLFGSGEVIARLLPALVGSAVVLLPAVFRESLGRKAALIAAFGLAFDPLLVAYSRQAGSPVLALGFMTLMLVCYRRQKSFLTGLFAGLTLLSGPSLVFGLLTLLAGWALTRYVSGPSLFAIDLEKQARLNTLIGLGFSLFIFGTLFLRYPQGLSAMFQALPDAFAGYFGGETAAGVPALQVLAAIPIYQPMALLFALIHFLQLRNYRHSLSIFLVGSVMGALLLITLDPARQVWMLIWVLPGLWLMAGRALAPYLSLPRPEDRLLALGEGLFFLILLVYWWFNLTKMTTIYVINIPPDANLFAFSSFDSETIVYIVRMLVTIFIPLLILLIAYLTSMMWGGSAPEKGTVWGVGIFLVFYLMVTAWNFTARPLDLAGELWVQGPSAGYADELIAAIEEASLQVTGTQNELDLVYQIDSPLIRWLLRDFPNARYSATSLQNDLPEAVLNRETGFETEMLAQFYRGEHLALQFSKDWNGSALPPDFDRWLVYRESPLEKDWVVFWRRADLFPLNSSQP